MRILALLITHIGVGLLGFVAGIYALPILTAPDAPTQSEVRSSAAAAEFSGAFSRDLQDSDALHWGEGTVYVGPDAIVLDGEIAPGPDYKLYLSQDFVETETDFLRLKSAMAQVGDVKTFKNFVVSVPAGIDVADYTSVIVWCESFDQFISAARYRN